MPWNVSVESAPIQTGYSWQLTDLLMLSIISITMFIRVVVNILGLFVIYKNNPVNTLGNKVQLVSTELKHAPFSFFNWLFWRRDIDPASDNGKRMITHELTHIYEQHSVDKLLIEVLLCMFWMNPFFWLIRRELSIIHEFVADRNAIRQQDGAAFAAMILQALQVQPPSTSGLVNPFFSSQIKRRLRMITTSKEPRYSYIRRLSGLALMICSTLFLTVSIQQVKAQQKEKTADKVTSQKNRAGERPANKKSEKPGEVLTVQADTLILNKDSSKMTVTGNQVKIETKPGNEGSVIIADNIIIIDEAKKPGKVEVKETKNVPIYILDGKEIDAKEVEAITPASIESVNVYKGESAVTKYGDKGRNGVIEINLKKEIELLKLPFQRKPQMQKIVALQKQK